MNDSEFASELAMMKKIAGIGEEQTSLAACFTNTTPRSINARKNAAEAMREQMESFNTDVETPTAINGEKIITSYDNPPIPSRKLDWSAVLDSYGGDESDPIGRGETEEEAIADLNAALEMNMNEHNEESYSDDAFHWESMKPGYWKHMEELFNDGYDTDDIMTLASEEFDNDMSPEEIVQMVNAFEAQYGKEVYDEQRVWKKLEKLAVEAGVKESDIGTLISYSLDNCNGVPEKEREECAITTLTMYINGEIDSPIGESSDSRLEEGTWALPDSKEKVDRLVALMQNPIPADQAADMLYGLLGDDNLFDSIDEVKQKDDPSDDVRPVIKHHLEKMAERVPTIQNVLFKLSRMNRMDPTTDIGREFRESYNWLSSKVQIKNK